MVPAAITPLITKLGIRTFLWSNPLHERHRRTPGPKDPPHPADSASPSHTERFGGLPKLGQRHVCSTRPTLRTKLRSSRM